MGFRRTLRINIWWPALDVHYVGATCSGLCNYYIWWPALDVHYVGATAVIIIYGGFRRTLRRGNVFGAL